MSLRCVLQPQDAGPRRLPSWAESPWSVRGQMFRLSRALWEAGATPGAVVRTLGPWGPGLIQKYARSRCEHGIALSVWCTSHQGIRAPGVFCSKRKAQAVTAVPRAAIHESRMPLSFSEGMQSLPCALVRAALGRAWGSRGRRSRRVRSILALVGPWSMQKLPPPWCMQIQGGYGAHRAGGPGV